jgi:hypothetical protein
MSRNNSMILNKDEDISFDSSPNSEPSPVNMQRRKTLRSALEPDYDENDMKLVQKPLENNVV